MNFFTQEHFDLLEKWQGQKSDPNNPEQQKDYQELKKAYEVTEKWAKTLQQKIFPNGKVKLRKSPVNQGGNFFEYNWAKIYPQQNSPEALAYTVGISTDGLTVKIDTVNVKKDLRNKYEEVRGDSANSQIVKTLSIAEGLNFDFDKLVEWSIDQINSFEASYEDVANAIGVLKLSKATTTKPLNAETQGAQSDMTLNTIFYGPPGTGKTYRTIDAAVNAAEPNFKANSREELKAKYDELVAEKRVRFVTFHQSYGYEEFVEGLRANSEQGQISYDVEAGIFKLICEQATQGIEPSRDPFEQALEKFKMTLEEEPIVQLKTQNGNSFDVQYHGNTTFRVFPEATNNEDLSRGYPVSIDNIRKLYRDANTGKLYNTSYVKGILNHIKQTYITSSEEIRETKTTKNFVLIIDEINRGNISKIFGELITLIEDSKRSGNGRKETLKVTLPYSGETFSVPDNLYIIGTMNTADRSLAMLDTALRRRFDFIEMMPQSAFFKGVVVEGINIHEMLDKMNERIEFLYDREHTLGHAFFLPVKALVHDEKSAFKMLESVFQNKVIPLLQEYFFDDWNKIRLVLGDNQKKPEHQFVVEEKQSLDSLFGNGHGLNSYQVEDKSYYLQDFKNKVWRLPEAYREINKIEKADS